MPKIAISYRRADSQAIVGRIFDRLAARYGKDEIYIDIDNIPLGMDFRSDIDQALREVKVLIVVVGQKWRGPRDREPPRIFDADDPVRREVETALDCKTRIVPVLIDNAAMPAAADLPEPLKSFSFLNALPVDSGRDFNDHIAHLIAALDRILGLAPAEPVAVEAPGTAANLMAVALAYLFVPAIVMAIAYYAIVHALDLGVRYVELASVLIAAAAGYLLAYREKRGPVWAALLGAGAAVIAVSAMLKTTSLIDGSPFVPATTREWQEAVEVAVLIVLGAVAGSLIERVLAARRAAPANTALK
jgi:hypothetical protein